MKDIENREDLIKLVNEFYRKVNQDELLAPVFLHVDWPKHFPIMYDFWSTMMLGDQSYTGNPFQKHVTLSVGAAHFERWLALFHHTVDTLYAGEKAQEIKDRARSIAYVWQHKLSQMRS